MRLLFTVLTFACCASGAAAQIVPIPEPGTPRMQMVEFVPGEPVLLTIPPAAGQTVFLENGEQIERITASDSELFEFRVSPDLSSFMILPLGNIDRSTMQVETNRRSYSFVARTQAGALAALVVRFRYTDGVLPVARVEASRSEPQNGPTWSYRLRGDREVFPAAIRDDARRTFIEYGPEQALPAVFAIGPTGDEEIVNGHMRGGTYVIDRVYGELVFRIDKEKATAQRNSQPDDEG